MPTICLAMIVRDEEPVIERCLRSVRGLIDSWVICDTGSTDATRDRAMEALKDIPGSWHQRPWVDFGHNRSELMALARGKGDYLLVLDADETVSWNPDVKGMLSAESYRIRHETDMEQWTNKRLVRGDIPWRYVGAVHERIEADVPDHEEFLADIVIEVHPEPRVPKLERNARLLHTQLERTPDDPRSTFYLAETYRDMFYLAEPARNMDHAVRALDCYRRRVALGGWEEEVFLSLYNIGGLTADALDDWPVALSALVEAWEYRPHRLEPLYRIVHGLRGRGAYHTAYALARRAREIQPPQDELFVTTWMYEYGLEFEYSVAAYWVGDFAGSLAASDRLLALPKLPPHYRPDVVRNRRVALEAMGMLSVPPETTSGRSG